MAGSVRLVFRQELARALGLDPRLSAITCSLEQGDRLADILPRLAAKNPAISTKVYDPEIQQINSLVQISINGRLLSLFGGIEAPLADGDRVLIFFAAGGG